MVRLATANTIGRGKFTAFGVVTADLEEMVTFISICSLSPIDLTDVGREFLIPFISNEYTIILLSEFKLVFCQILAGYRRDATDLKLTLAMIIVAASRPFSSLGVSAQISTCYKSNNESSMPLFIVGRCKIMQAFSSLKHFNATFNDKNHIHSLILQARDVRLITPSLSSLKTSPYCIMHTELLTSFVLDINGNGYALRFEVADNVYNAQDASVLY
uniref:Uncharacterized protein n=1 Tax=Glossina austeni TaxID=7395 RepID=A0A1A9VKZ0_GLOAU